MSNQYDENYPFLKDHLERQAGITEKLTGPIKAWNEYVLPLNIPRGSNVLDVGACTGALMNKLQWIGGYEMFGIDLNEAAINAGKQIHCNLDLAVANAQYLPFANNTFDSVISQDLLEHIPEELLHITITEFRRVKRGRRMIHKVTVSEDKDWIDADATHVTKKPVKWWINFFQGAGFKVAKDPHAKYLDRWKCFPVLKDMHGYFVLDEN